MERPEEVDLTQHHLVSLSDVGDERLRNRIASVINLMDNTIRGTVAEVLVAAALGGEVTDQWGNWDVNLPNGTKVEVKATGLVQAWEQTKPSKPVWSIARSQDWVLSDGVYSFDGGMVRSSDYYVLALHTGTRPDEVDEWLFYVVSTADIDGEFVDQKTVSKAALERRLQLSPMTYSDLTAVDLMIP